ncbi:MAG: HipA domain-containing protein [Candidatus Nanopelagicaceae bacterium]|nr:HipA domain-containing protein [Candidatus Nanopelagicaceae bacterium]
MADLKVELYGYPIGRLTKTRGESFDFRTDEMTFEHFQLGSTILSESVPLLAVQSRSGSARRQNYFAEMLPEGRILENLADTIGASEKDVITLLTHFGRDVAGAIQVYDPSQPGEPLTPRTIEVTEKEVHNLLANTKITPLANRPILGKTSLAGVQDKILLAKIKNTWHQVIDGYPSTHIVKPESKDYPTIIFDEEYGARFARAVDLASHATVLVNFKGTTGLVIERYDRSASTPPERIHQEDMNQALGARGNQKYQELGGRVSLRRIAGIFGKYGDNDSLSRLLKLNTLAIAIGNLDLHAKNISVLHLPNGDSTMAPAYDTVPLVHIPENDKRMALAVNGKYFHAEISVADIVAEAISWGIKNPEKTISDTLEIIRTVALNEHPDPRAYKHLSQEIGIFTQNLLDGKSAMGA